MAATADRDSRVAVLFVCSGGRDTPKHFDETGAPSHAFIRIDMIFYERQISLQNGYNQSPLRVDHAASVINYNQPPKKPFEDSN